MRISILKCVLSGFLALALSACGYAPQGVVPVQGFVVERYLGKWYEIARLDHSFERGLINVSAEYSLGDDGGVKVINRGFDPKGNKWKTALGRAYFTQGQSVGQLKVSFFGPFYGGYNIIELDQAGYSYALVCGPSRSYLWILARTPKLESCFREKLLFRAKELGFETDKLIWVVQQE